MGNSTSNGGLISNKGGQDGIIVKYDKDGNLLWNKNFGGSSLDSLTNVVEDKDGNYLAIGTSSSNDGDIINPNGGTDSIIVKFDKNGNNIWTNILGGAGSDTINGIIPLNDGHYIASGYTNSNNTGIVPETRGGNDFWIVKITNLGQLQWSKTYGGPLSDTFASHGVSTSDGGVVFTGSSSSINGDISENKGSTDIILFKIDKDGNKSWVKNYGGTGSESGSSISKTSDGGYIISGSYSVANGDFAGLTNFGSTDGFILKVK